MKPKKIQNYLIWMIPLISVLVGCPPGGSSMTGDQFRETMRSGAAGESPDVQRRIERGTNGYRSIDPSGVIDSFVEPCTSCDNDAHAGREVSVGSSDLAENFARMGGTARALSHALCFMDRHKNTNFNSAAGGKVRIKDPCKFAINEHAGRGERANKMFILNRCSGEVKVMNVARGSGGIGQGKGKTNPGFHIMGGDHNSPSGKVWSPGVKMHGIQRGINDEAYGRGVVMHRAMNSRGGYCSGGMASSNNPSSQGVGGSCGRTNGCPGVDPSNWKTVVNDLRGDNGGGPLMYNYTNREASKSDDYCGDSLWQ